MFHLLQNLRYQFQAPIRDRDRKIEISIYQNYNNFIQLNQTQYKLSQVYKDAKAKNKNLC